MIDYKEINQWRIYNSMNRKVHVSRDVKFDELNIYDDVIVFNDNEEKLSECWNKQDNLLFYNIAQNEAAIKGVTLEDSSKESCYLTLISDNLLNNSVIMKADALENLEEEKKNKKIDLLHIFESLEHVISQRIMMSSIDRSVKLVSKVTKKSFQTTQEKQKK